MGCSFIAPIQSALGQVANVVAPIAAAIPGPWQLPALAYNVYNAASQGNVVGAIAGATGIYGLASQAGSLANAASNSYNGLANVASGISNGTGVASSLSNAAGSAYNYATEAAALQAVQPGLSTAQAAALAQAGVAPSGIQGAALADVQSGANGLIDMSATGVVPAAATGATGSATGSVLGSLAQGAASVYGAQQVAQSAQNAATINQAATQGALQLQATQFNQSQANQQPWLTAGTQALGAQQDLMGLGVNGAAGQLTALQSSPGYQFQLDQGNKGLTNSLAARGGMGSGASAVAASKYNQDYASTAYNNRLAQLSSLSTTGQNTATGMGAQAMNYANNASSTGIAGANTQANAGLVAAQANQSGLVGASNALMGYLNPSQSTLRAA